VRLTVQAGKTVEFHGPADITRESTDAIVNAANSSLMGGGGVDGAIHDAGGPEILEECKRYVGQHGRLPAGRAMVTGSGLLPARHVIHTVGPVYHGGGNIEAELLSSCYRECMRIAEERKLTSLSFPAISTGAYGYPLDEAAQIAVSAVLDSLQRSQHVRQVRFVLFDSAALRAFSKAANTAARRQSELRIEVSAEEDDLL
jgi:O-acetyl-ADP-ribose deacetylase (regulator of RNase III)